MCACVILLHRQQRQREWMEEGLDSLSSHVSGCGSEDSTLGFRSTRQASEQASQSPGTGGERLSQHSNKQLRGLQPTPVSMPPCLVTCTTWPKSQPQKHEKEMQGGEEALHREKRGESRHKGEMRGRSRGQAAWTEPAHLRFKFLYF